MPERTRLSAYHRDTLLNLAYLGTLTYPLLHELTPGASLRTLQRDMPDMRRLGLVDKIPLAKPGPHKRPIDIGDIWLLTEQGHQYIKTKAADQYPLKPAKVRHKRVMLHDLLVAKVIVR